MEDVLVTGGAGYIGSHCVLSLLKSGYNPIVIDSLINSKRSVIHRLSTISNKKIKFYKIDLIDKINLRKIFKKHNFKYVIHFAGLKSVRESLKKPNFYYRNNILSTLNLLECMNEKKIYNLIFSSSACVYSSDQKIPFTEKSLTYNINTTYGKSKYFIEEILKDISLSNPKWKIGIARYFNVVGNHPSGLIYDDPKNHPENLMPYINMVIKKKFPYLKVFGDNYATKDGTCIRDYIHVMDLAEGHIQLLKKLRKLSNIEIFNFGTGKPISVLEIIRAFEKVCEVKLPYKIVRRRAGDVPVSFCNPKKAEKLLSWKAKHNLVKIMLDIKKTL